VLAVAGENRDLRVFQAASALEATELWMEAPQAETALVDQEHMEELWRNSAPQARDCQLPSWAIPGKNSGVHADSVNPAALRLSPVGVGFVKYGCGSLTISGTQARLTMN
jgi:hypothetical protein